MKNPWDDFVTRGLNKVQLLQNKIVKKKNNIHQLLSTLEIQVV
jgi:hypothetical protein